MTLRRIAIVATIVLAATTITLVVTESPAAAANFGDSRTESYVLPETASYGQAIQMGATVYDDSTSCDLPPYPFGCNTPTGTVYWFLDDRPGYFASDEFLATTPGPDFSGAGPTFASNIGPGTHTVTARYVGGVSNTGNPRPFNNSEDTKTLTITKATVDVTLSQGSPNPSEFGTPVSFGVTVAPNPAVNVAGGAALPTGTVQLTEGSTVLAEGPIDAAGNATLTTDALPVGDHPDLAIAYLGDANYDLRASNEVTQTVAQASSGVALTSTPSPSTYGENVVFTATVTPATATGSVDFTVDGFDVGAVPLVGGVATYEIAVLTAEPHEIIANYPGDANLDGSATSLTHEVGKAVPSVIIDSGPNPSKPGQPVTVTAEVLPGFANGTVTFRDGSAALATVPLEADSSGGHATFTTSSLAVGAHNLTVVYSGGSNHEAATSLEPVTQVVEKADTTTSVAVPVGGVDFGSSAPLLVTVTPVAPGSGGPTGTVTLREGAAVVGTATLAPGTNGSTASFDVANLLPGSHSFIASYPGDGGFNGSASLGAIVNVTCATNVTEPISGDLEIAEGSTCVSSPTVDGVIYIGAGARAHIVGTTVAGGIRSAHASTVALCGVETPTTSITTTTGPVLVGDEVGGRCAGNTMNYLNASMNKGGVEISDNDIAGGIVLVSNLGPSPGSIAVEANVMQVGMVCMFNDPPPTNNGRPNQSPLGDCAS